MQTQPGVMDEFAIAVASERAAWEAVRHRLPGTAGFSQELWKNWRASVEEADKAAERAKNRIAVQPKPLGPRFMGSRWPPQAVRLSPVISGRPKA
jgi:hypothetical protein